MTWLQGVTTWGALCGKLTQVACGEAPDDLAVTCAPVDRWVRDISTSYDLIRTPASKDVNTGTMYNRTGYFSLMSYGETLSTNGTYGWHKGVCKITTAFNGVPSIALNNRWIVWVSVQTPNTVAGNYSNASVRVCIADAEYTNNTGQNVTLNAAGTATITFTTSKTMTINCTDPSGILVNNTLWMRAFTNIYPGGIDWFGPMWSRRSGNATFTVPPSVGGGVAGTDYDVNVDIATAWPAYSSVIAFQFGTSQGAPTPQGGPFGGVGYKTSAALTGVQYACSWPMALNKVRIWAQSGITNGQISLDYGGNGQDDGGTYRRIGGFTATAWMRPFFTPGSVEATSQVQWWMSVKADKLIIVLNADPGYSGLLTFNGTWPFTPIDYFGGGLDKFPIVYGRIPQAQGQAGTTSQQPSVFHAFTYWQQKLRQDGSESRDWQTGWMRSDLYWNALVSVGSGGSTSNGFGLSALSFTTASQTYHTPGLMDSVSNQGGFGDVFMPLNAIKPNPITGKWRMFTHAIADKPMSAHGGTTGTSSYATLAEEDTPRGYVAATIDAPFLIVPGYVNVGTSFGSGDELTDTVSGRKWFMVKADAVFIGSYCGLLGELYNNLAAVNIPGYAILEN